MKTERIIFALIVCTLAGFWAGWSLGELYRLFLLGQLRKALQTKREREEAGRGSTP